MPLTSALDLIAGLVRVMLSLKSHPAVRLAKAHHGIPDVQAFSEPAMSDIRHCLAFPTIAPARGNFSA
jgi:hypothetical protein